MEMENRRGMGGEGEVWVLFCLLAVMPQLLAQVGAVKCCTMALLVDRGGTTRSGN